MKRAIIAVSLLAVVATAATVVLSGLTWYKANASMEPTIRSGQTMGVDKAAYRVAADVRRLDVIAFRFPESPEHIFVKRVIGLPGEQVSIKDGRVLINQAPLAAWDQNEARSKIARQKDHAMAAACAFEVASISVPDNAVFVLGDSCNSRDSRFWGPLRFPFIVGKVVDIR